MTPARQAIRSDAAIWRLAFAFTGIGCAFIAPCLPALTAQWDLHDRRAGVVVSCLFLGSFTGTLSLSSNLRTSLHRGCLSAFLGMLFFALCTQWPGGFVFGASALALLGYGLGQLMSAMNLLVGAGNPATAPQRLASTGAAWCIGAVLSPILTTLKISAVSPSWRIALFSSLFLLPILQTRGRELPLSGIRDAAPGEHSRSSRIVILCAFTFFLYGGVESSVAGWMPLFAIRYALGSTASSQWTISLFGWASSRADLPSRGS